jgi:hypothetical protein
MREHHYGLFFLENVGKVLSQWTSLDARGRKECSHPVRADEVIE